MRQALALFTAFVVCLAFGCSKAGQHGSPRSPNGSSLQEVRRVTQAARAGEVLASMQADLEGDGKPETIAITCRKLEDGRPMGGEVVVLQPKDGSLGLVWRQRELNPWKLWLADVDGDGKREIVVGVWKKSPKDPVMAKRTFVYSWNGKRMLPKWLGSRLSRRFDDFALADINKDGWDELLALEVAPKGKHRVAAYRWRCFGFDWLGCSEEKAGLTGLTSEHDNVTVAAPNGKLKVKYSNGKLSLIR